MTDPTEWWCTNEAKMEIYKTLHAQSTIKMLGEFKSKLIELDEYLTEKEFDADWGEYTFFSNDIDDLDSALLSMSYVEVEESFYGDETLTKKVISDINGFTNKEITVMKEKLKFINSLANALMDKELNQLSNDDLEELTDSFDEYEAIKTQTEEMIELINTRRLMITKHMELKKTGVVIDE